MARCRTWWLWNTPVGYNIKTTCLCEALSCCCNSPDLWGHVQVGENLRVSSGTSGSLLTHPVNWVLRMPGQCFGIQLWEFTSSRMPGPHISKPTTESPPHDCHSLVCKCGSRRTSHQGASVHHHLSWAWCPGRGWTIRRRSTRGLECIEILICLL